MVGLIVSTPSRNLVGTSPNPNITTLHTCFSAVLPALSMWFGSACACIVVTTHYGQGCGELWSHGWITGRDVGHCGHTGGLQAGMWGEAPTTYGQSETVQSMVIPLG